MTNILKLILPVLLPSWGFFDRIAASPRIEYALITDKSSTDYDWKDFTYRPQSRSLTDFAKSLIYNAHWNESLFAVSCAGRLLDHPTPHSEQQIIDILTRRQQPNPKRTPYLQFRIHVVEREGDKRTRDLAYISTLHNVKAHHEL